MGQHTLENLGELNNMFCLINYFLVHILSMEQGDQSNQTQNQSVEINFVQSQQPKAMDLTTNLETVSIDTQNQQIENEPVQNQPKPPEPDTKYQEYCLAILGRKYSCQTFQNMYQAISLIFADISQMQLPFEEMFNFAGIFIFKEHVLIEPSLFARNVNSTTEEIIKHCSEELEIDDKPGTNFKQIMASKIGPSFSEWKLYHIPEKPETKEILAVLTKFKAVSISSFEETHEPLPPLEYTYQEIAHIDCDPELFYQKMHPGTFYAKLVDESLKSTKEKCWILK